MSPALIALLTPILSGLVSLLAGPAEHWLVDHAITYLTGVIARSIRLDASWTMSAAVSDPASGTVTVTVGRHGRTAIVLVFEPLGLTAAHQETIAALLGTLFHEGEKELLAVFTRARGPSVLAGASAGVAR